MKRSRSRLLLLGSSTALAATLAAGGVAFFSIEERPSLPLPDGTRLQIDSVQYGQGAPVVYGPAWKRRLRPLVPYLLVPLADPLRTESIDPETRWPQNALTVWLECHEGHGNIPYCELQDSHGCRFRAVEQMIPQAEIGSPVALLFPLFPRREASFGVNLYFYIEGPKRMGRLSVASPVPTRYPTWSPEALPVTRTSGPLRVTLKEITTGWCESEPRRPAREDEVELTRLTLQSAGSSEWKVARVTLSDAMGGSYEFGAAGRWSKEGAVYMQAGNVCREEAAYRYRLEYSRANTSGAAPDRQYSLGSLQAGLRRVRTQEVLLPSDGRKLQVSVDTTPDREYLQAEWKPAEGEVGRLWVEGRLRNRPWRQPANSIGPLQGSQNFDLRLPLGLTGRRLRLDLYQSRFVTFTVKPKWVTKYSSCSENGPVTATGRERRFRTSSS